MSRVIRAGMDWTINATAFSSDSFKGGQMPPELFSLIFLIAVIVVLLQLRTRKLRLWVVWIPMVIFIPLTAVTIGVDYGGPGTLLLSAAGFAIGCAAGAFIGSRMEVKVDGRGRILLKGSAVAVAVWILVLGAKMFGRGIIGDAGVVSLNDLAAAALAMTLGLMIARRAYVTLKYLELKGQAMPATQDVKVP